MTQSNNRWKVQKNGYKFDLWIFRIYIFLVIIVTAGVFLGAGGLKEYTYVSCPKSVPGMCINELYKQCDDPICDVEYILPGQSLGEAPPSGLINYVNYFWITIFIPFIINHFKNNKDFKFDVDIK